MTYASSRAATDSGASVCAETACVFPSGSPSLCPGSGTSCSTTRGGSRGSRTTRARSVHDPEHLPLEHRALRHGPRDRGDDRGRLPGHRSRRGPWLRQRHPEGTLALRGAWLGSRGPLVGLGLQLREARPEAAEQDAWLDLWLRGIPDGGDDRGLIRIEPEERDGLRSWLYARGRYPFDDQQWLDFVWTRQSDPGVQSEFFEREYLAYEQRDTYLHWRKARGDEYLQATVSVRSDPWRAELEQQPSVGYSNGSSELGSFLGVPLLYAASADAARLNRRGDGDLPACSRSPGWTSTASPDGLGDQEVTRIDAWQELSAPLDLGGSGATLVPSVEFRASAWDRSRANAGAIQRAGALAGLGARRLLVPLRGGDRHPPGPLRPGHARTLDGGGGRGRLLRFDRVEDPLGGDRLDAGFRMRWRRPSRDDQLDLELGLIQHVDRPLDAPDLEAGRALARLQTTVSGVPTGLLHDGRYGLDGGDRLQRHDLRRTSRRRPGAPAEPQPGGRPHGRGRPVRGDHLPGSDHPRSEVGGRPAHPGEHRWGRRSPVRGGAPATWARLRAGARLLEPRGGGQRGQHQLRPAAGLAPSASLHPPGPRPLTPEPLRLARHPGLKERSRSRRSREGRSARGDLRREVPRRPGPSTSMLDPRTAWRSRSEPGQ